MMEGTVTADAVNQAGPRRPTADRIDRRSLMSLLGAGAAYLILARNAKAQQVPIPTTATEVPGPASGTAMTTAYVQSVARTAYMWGWPLVNVANRADAFSKAPEPGLLGGVVPVAFNRNAMLTGYISPDEHFITCPNQDVVYGAGYFALDKEPIVFQVPQFGDRFWVYPLYDARTDEFSSSRVGPSHLTPMRGRSSIRPPGLPTKRAASSASNKSSAAFPTGYTQTVTGPIPSPTGRRQSRQVH